MKNNEFWDTKKKNAFFTCRNITLLLEMSENEAIHILLANIDYQVVFQGLKTQT